MGGRHVITHVGGDCFWPWSSTVRLSSFWWDKEHQLASQFREDVKVNQH
jgi:hypothetical protein